MKNHFIGFISWVPVLLIPNACTQSEFKTIDFKTFTIETPSKWKKLEFKGIDSYVGGLITSKRDTLLFDYGFYSNELDIHSSYFNHQDVKIGEEYQIDTSQLIHKEEFKTIDGRKAKIIYPKEGKDGFTGVYFDSVNQAVEKFNFYGSLKNKEESLIFREAIKTIKFNKK